MTAAHVQAFLSGDVAAGPARRARNKLEKRQRIREATRELFSAQGFEVTTVRQIAERVRSRDPHRPVTSLCCFSPSSRVRCAIGCTRWPQSQRRAWRCWGERTWGRSPSERSS